MPDIFSQVTVCDFGGNSVTAGPDEATTTPHQNNTLPTVNLPMKTAPTLRVEELKDEEGQSSSYYSEEDGFASHGDYSDNPEGGDSAPFVPPDDDLKAKIISQVEFYFSDANILKDTFLLKHVRRNKLGYVSCKLITGFRKVKSLTKDFRVVAYSLRSSESMEVNEEGTKIRRKSPLPDYDETVPSRSIVVMNLPQENPSIESVAEIFSDCGDIALVRILKPGKSIPTDLQRFARKHPEMGEKVCAIVEFELHEHAQKACEMNVQENEDGQQKGMRVAVLNEKKKKENDNKEDLDNADDEKRRRKRGGRKKRNSRVEELHYEEGASSCSEGEPLSTPPRSVTPNRSRNSLSPKPDMIHLSPQSTPRSSPRSSPRGSPNMRRRITPGKSPLVDRESPRHSPMNSPDVQRRNYDSGDSAGSTSPWVQRRLKAAQDKSPLAQDISPGGSPLLGRRLPDGSINRCGSPVPRMADMEGVMRQPRGPDGSTGFYGGRGRGVPIKR